MGANTQPLRVPNVGAVKFGAAGGDVRPFSLRLAKLDEPIPMTPSGGDESLKYVMTTEAAERNIGSIINRPVRIAPGLDSHRKPGADGLLADVYGHIQNSYIQTEADGNYWVVDGFWYANQNPGLTEVILANIDEIGGSYEVYATGEWPQNGDTVFVDNFRATGLAILSRNRAAYQQMTRMVYAESFPALRQLAAEAQDAAIEQIRDIGEQFLRQLTTDGGADVAGAAPEEPTVIETEAGAEPEPPEGGEGASMDELATRLEEVVAEMALLKADFAKTTEDLKARDEQLASVASALSAEGAESVADLIVKFKDATTALEVKVAEYEGELATARTANEALQAEADGLKTQVAESAAEVEFEKIRETIEAESHERVLDIMKRAARGESVPLSELALMASARVAPAVPDGTQTAHAEPAKDVTPEADPVKSLYAEASKIANSEERLSFVGSKLTEAAGV